MIGDDITVTVEAGHKIVVNPASPDPQQGAANRNGFNRFATIRRTESIVRDIMTHGRRNLVADLREGVKYCGMWLMSDSADIARISSSVGFDYVAIDLQHGLARDHDVLRLSDAIRAGGDSAVVVRASDNRFAEIGMLADAGVDAIIVPLVSSVEEAEGAVRALEYPGKLGERSWGPTMPLMLGTDTGPDAPRPALFVMIENSGGLESVEEICVVDGVDGIYIGPSDLAYALGSLPGPEEQATTNAIAHILEVATRAGVVPGIHCANGEEARLRREQGFCFITTSSDVGAARRAYITDLATGREVGA